MGVGRMEKAMRVLRLCGRHPFVSLLAVVGIPELFLLIMGLLCKGMPQLLGASSVYVALYALLWIVGILVWIAGMIRRLRCADAGHAAHGVLPDGKACDMSENGVSCCEAARRARRGNGR